MQNWKPLGLLLALSAILFSLAIGIILGARRDTRGRERRRRSTVNQYGRLGDALITEVVGATIFFSYSLSGVVYTASQDVSDLKEILPDEPVQVDQFCVYGLNGPLARCADEPHHLTECRMG